MPRLVIAPGQPLAGVFELGLGTTTIGRADNNGVQLPHESLSRVHAQVEVTPEGATVVDLHSKNGTFLNDVRVERSTLRAGDTLQCGDVIFVYDPDLQSASPTPPTLTCRAVARYSRDDVRDLLEATPLGTSALRLRHQEPEQRAADKLQILLRVSQLLSGAESLDTLMDTMLELVFEVFEVDRAAILLVDEKTGALEPRAHKVSARATPGFSRRISGYVRERGIGALFQDALEDERVSPSTSVVSQAICAAMAAPFKPRSDVIGVLYVDSLSMPCRFDREDLEFLSSFANHAAVAIENAQLNARLQREAVLRNNLLRFFPPSALSRMQALEELARDTIEAEVTALFCDISGFTALSEDLPPREIFGLLNDYFPMMADVIFRWDGTLEKYIGDALLAVWGAPFSHDDDPDRAVAAAADMQRALLDLNQRWAKEHRRKLAIHIGINSGRVAAGNIGSERYLQYATIGDATNVAARLCTLAGPGEIVISERTRSALRGVYTPTQELPPARIRGREQPVRIHRLDWQRVDAFPSATEPAVRPVA